MLIRLSKLFINTTIISLLFCASVSANAYYSNDPQGKIFLKKPFGDITNCGPISALMLTQFAYGNKHVKDIDEAIDKARMSVQKEAKRDIDYRWWSFRDIKTFLNQQQVNFSEIDTKNFRHAQSRSSKIVKAISNGSVVVVNIDMNDLDKNAEIGKFYGTTKLFGRWGHFLVIVGYKKVNGQLAYEIHDSYSYKGKNRLFYAKDINQAISKYNKKLLIVSKKVKATQDDIFSKYFQ